MATKLTGRTARETLDRHIEEARAEMDRLREEYGDPEEAWRDFVRQNFDRDALIATYRDWLRERGKWIEDEEGGPDPVQLADAR